MVDCTAIVQFCVFVKIDSFSVFYLLREALSDRRTAGSRWNNSFMIGFHNLQNKPMAFVGFCGEAICEKSV
jgi:hypothetical protein